MKKKLSLLVTAVLGISLAAFPAYAQKKPQTPSKKTGQNQRMSMEQRFAKELNLTAAQQSKINPILKKQSEQMRAIFQNGKLTPEQKRAQSAKLYESLPSKINKYLNKTQQTKLKEMVSKGKNFRTGRRGGMGKKPGTPPKKK